jgi:hypothetical protein
VAQAVGIYLHADPVSGSLQTDDGWMGKIEEIFDDLGLFFFRKQY